ncbi:conserved hypothetical protein [Gloeothece citriformis PCC 7424]|uniref:Uncharacterized protein n=1 Tax=Gloeothece citriformis (strain PCC 7424) TaxID=65393 RepID=B7KE74_GLOC7|nr:hypothetical protein [Gloeothece citriformis]ACK71772.1 conserved hypothetical protein [Gloeothece citriformis PCC 7424]
MLIFVIICNFVLSTLNLYIALRLWRLRRTLKRITRTLTFVERRIDTIFTPAPQFVIKGQQGTHALRLYYQQLSFQLEQVQKLIRLINLGLRIWQRQARFKKSQSSPLKFKLF